MSSRRVLLDYLVATVLPFISVANGFNTTPGMIERGLYSLDQLGDDKFPVVLIADTSETRKNITNTQFNASLEVLIIGAVKNPTGYSGNQDALDDLVEDITEALERDRTQGGRCHSMQITKVETDGGDAEARAACYFTVVFQYAAEGTHA